MKQNTRREKRISIKEDGSKPGSTVKIRQENSQTIFRVQGIAIN